jgi:ribosomal protein L29
VKDIDDALRALSSLYIAVAEPVALSIGQMFRPLLKELAELRDKQVDVLRVLTPEQITAALHEGRAEAMASTGDNAWTSLLRQRDEARRELAELKMLLKERDEY